MISLCLQNTLTLEEGNVGEHRGLFVSLKYRILKYQLKVVKF
jgi:hypothetical protein